MRRRLTALSLAVVLALAVLPPMRASAADGWGAPPGDTHMALLRDASGRPLFVEYVLQDGVGVFQGDIILGPHAELQRSLVAGLAQLDAPTLEAALARFPQLESRLSELAKTDVPFGLGILDYRRMWPGGVVPYELSRGLPQKTRADVVRAIQAWNATGSVQFKPAGPLPLAQALKAGRLVIRPSSDAGVCNSGLGRAEVGATVVNLGSGCGFGVIVHELGHAIGLGHEHLRSDRETMMAVDLANVTDFGKAQIDYCAWRQGNDLCNGIYEKAGAYDPCSIMHYGERLPRDTRWLVNPSGSDVVFRLTPSGAALLETCAQQFASPPCRQLGQRCAASTADLATVRKLYAKR